MTMWQPIETARKDGKAMLLAVPVQGEVVVTIGGYDPIWSTWVFDNKRIPLGSEPARWMPRPEPPMLGDHSIG